MSISGIFKTLIIIYLTLLITLFLLFGIADFSIADSVPNPSKISVLGGAVVTIIAIGIRLRIDALTIEKDVWSSDTITINQDSETNTNNGCLGISSVFSKVIGSVIYLLLFPFGFTVIGELAYKLNWWSFSTVIEWWPPLIYGISFFCLFSGTFATSVVYYEWSLSRLIFLGFIFPNQQLFYYTIIPCLVGIWISIIYKIVKQLILISQE